MTKDAIHQAIGRNIRAFRAARGLTAVEFGELAGKKLGIKPWVRQTVYMMETGDRAFAIADLLAIAEILEVTLDDLIGNDYFPKHSTPFDGEAILKVKIADAISELSRIAAQI